MLNPKAPTRADLARVFSDPRTLTAFEQLFEAVPSGINDNERAIISLQLLLSGGGAAVNAMRGEITRLRQQVAQLQAQAPRALPMSRAIDYIDFTASPRYVARPQRIAWNAAEDTLNIHHDDGVTQQVGLETYVRVLNNTGSTIANGNTVGFGGVLSGTPLGVKYIANGTMPIGYFGGVATEDIPNGTVGRITVFGFVHDIDTSAFSVGSIVYASPTTAGAITATKPTAPQFAIPVGVVAVSNATTGSVFVRPIIEQTKYYGRFLKTTDQTPAAINTAYALTIDVSSISNGVSIGAPTSRIVVANSGLYRFNASYQLTSGSASVKNVWLWFRKNGADLPNSAIKCSLESATAVNTQVRSLFESMVAGDYMELMFASDSTNMTVDNIAATAFAPAAPAVILSVDQIQQ